MIITRLIGGLGNQMFQYAAGRRLALRHGTTLKMDISPFSKYERQAYCLTHFNIIENIATEEELKPFHLGALGKLADRFLGKTHGTPEIREKHFHFDPEILDAPDNVMLAGYWQSEKYFQDAEEIIRGEFTIKTPQAGQDLELASILRGSNSVSLHIRRRDYVLDPKTNQTHGTCSLEYYGNSTNYLAKRIGALRLFVFSDDIPWARENLRIPHAVTFVDHNDASRNYEDLRLMSQCEHHIIANSTFSWWAAWLGTNPARIVCAPARWFKDPRHNTRDIYPADWVRI